jgi:hypothetical protein
MISQTQVPQETVVLEDMAQQGLKTGFVFVNAIAMQETLVQFDYLAQGQVLSRRPV